MSKIIKAANIRQLSHIVETDNGKWYLVDSRDLSNSCLGSGLELMVFKVSKRTKCVSDWKNPIVEEHPKTYEELYTLHNKVCNNLEAFL